MPLYGNELDLDTNPFEAGLGRVVKLAKPGDFVGRAALEKVEPRRARRVGSSAWSSEGRGIARHGYPVWSGDRRTGVVTSGTQSPDARRPDRDGVRRTGATPSRVPLSMSRSAMPESRPGSSPCRSTGGSLNRWCRPTCATPTTTSGSASRATRRPSGSPPTPPTSSATSSTWSCRTSAARSSSSPRSASSNRSRRSATCSRRSAAR